MAEKPTYEELKSRVEQVESVFERRMHSGDDDSAEGGKTEETLLQGGRRSRTPFETMAEGIALQEIILDDKGRPCDYGF